MYPFFLVIKKLVCTNLALSLLSLSKHKAAISSLVRRKISHTSFSLSLSNTPFNEFWRGTNLHGCVDAHRASVGLQVHLAVETSQPCVQHAYALTSCIFTHQDVFTHAGAHQAMDSRPADSHSRSEFASRVCFERIGCPVLDCVWSHGTHRDAHLASDERAHHIVRHPTRHPILGGLRHFELSGKLICQPSFFPLSAKRLAVLLTCKMGVHDDSWREDDTRVTLLPQWASFVASHAQVATEFSLKVNGVKPPCLDFYTSCPPTMRAAEFEFCCPTCCARVHTFIQIREESLHRLSFNCMASEYNPGATTCAAVCRLLLGGKLAHLDTLCITNLSMPIAAACGTLLTLPCIARLTTLRIGDYAWPIATWPVDTWAHCFAPSNVPCLSTLELLVNQHSHYAMLEHMPALPCLTSLHLSADPAGEENAAASNNHLLTCVAKQSHLTTLELDGFDGSMLASHAAEALCAVAASLRHVVFDSEEILVRVAAVSLRHAFLDSYEIPKRAVPSITSFVLASFRSWNSIWSLPASLEVLEFAEDTDSTGVYFARMHLEALSRACPRLRDLDLSSCNNLDVKSTWRFLTNSRVWPGLERIILPAAYARRSSAVRVFNRARPLQTRVTFL
jgi:hypothetical protein